MKKLEFYILNVDQNNKPEMQNIFNSIYVQNSLEKLKKKKNVTKDELKEELNSVFMFAFWSKIQFELEVKRKFDKDEPGYIDAYEQLKPNLDLITEYVHKTLFGKDEG